MRKSVRIFTLEELLSNPSNPRPNCISEQIPEFFSNGAFEIGQIQFIESEKFVIQNASKSFEIDLNQQHGLIQRTIKQSEINPNPKMKIIDDCLISQLNDDWIYLIEMKNNRVIAQYRI